jgi:CMP-N-acetylneuraminic acid synthetase
MSSRSDAVVAVIPARGGSKGIPRKNLVRLGGRPLIAYTIEAARRARLVDAVLVTTDSPEIARAARRLGAEIPFRRPRALAGDAVSVVEAARHAVRWLAEQGRKPEIVVLLQPTSPLRSAARIDEAVRLLRRRRADTVVSVREPETHPWQCVRFAKGRMRFAVPRPARRLNRQAPCTRSGRTCCSRAACTAPASSRWSWRRGSPSTSTSPPTSPWPNIS